jgi:type IV secretory pathway VirB2 component (pilin)
MKKLSAFLMKATLLSFFFFAVAPTAISIVSASDALADSGSDIGTAIGTDISNSVNDNILVNTMCRSLKIITGNAGKAFAAFAIISIGIGFFTGKVSWGLMIGVAAGIAAMFGAPSIVSAITGESTFDCGAKY